MHAEFALLDVRQDDSRNNHRPLLSAQYQPVARPECGGEGVVRSVPVLRCERNVRVYAGVTVIGEASLQRVEVLASLAAFRVIVSRHVTQGKTIHGESTSFPNLLDWYPRRRAASGHGRGFDVDEPQPTGELSCVRVCDVPNELLR